MDTTRIYLVTFYDHRGRRFSRELQANGSADARKHVRDIMGAEYIVGCKWVG